MQRGKPAPGFEYKVIHDGPRDGRANWLIGRWHGYYVVKPFVDWYPDMESWIRAETAVRDRPGLPDWEHTPRKPSQVPADLAVEAWRLGGRLMRSGMPVFAKSALVDVIMTEGKIRQNARQKALAVRRRLVAESVIEVSPLDITIVAPDLIVRLRKEWDGWAPDAAKRRKGSVPAKIVDSEASPERSMARCDAGGA